LQASLREALINFQYSEKIKSELIIAFALLEKMSELEGSEFTGAKKIILSFFDSLLNEVRIAGNVTRLKTFSEIKAEMTDAMEKIEIRSYNEAYRHVSKAVSLATTLCHKAIQKLKENGLML